ncbi:hypothetical protein [Streptomyces rimosus]|uniref:hypothetical protein n=1 Tax=Streptomyces rimosus TaxID=1927 RepID=UPI00131D872E|nr:hypothetical protein [Streptomyces rimosus]
MAYQEFLDVAGTVEQYGDEAMSMSDPAFVPRLDHDKSGELYERFHMKADRVRLVGPPAVTAAVEELRQYASQILRTGNWVRTFDEHAESSADNDVVHTVHDFVTALAEFRKARRRFTDVAQDALADDEVP